VVLHIHRDIEIDHTRTRTKKNLEDATQLQKHVSLLCDGKNSALWQKSNTAEESADEINCKTTDLTRAHKIAKLH